MIDRERKRREVRAKGGFEDCLSGMASANQGARVFDAGNKPAGSNCRIAVYTDGYFMMVGSTTAVGLSDAAVAAVRESSSTLPASIGPGSCVSATDAANARWRMSDETAGLDGSAETVRCRDGGEPSDGSLAA